MIRYRIVFKNNTNKIGGNCTGWILMTSATTIGFMNRYVNNLKKYYGSDDYEIEYKEGE